MKKPLVSLNESERLKALESYSIMDSLPEKEYDSITQLASYICGTPISLITLLDENRQWFKSTVGIEITETSREISFCQHTIIGEGIYEVNNALENKIFSDNPLVTGNPDIRFYAGASLRDKSGFNLGSLCVIDTKPRILSNEQKNALQLLADQVVSLLELRKKNADLNTTQLEFNNFIELSKELVCIANLDGTFRKVNPSFTIVLGYSKEELKGRPFVDFIHPEDLDKTYKELEKLALGHKTISFENRYRCKNGAYSLLSWNSSPDPTSGNLYCIARDITFERSQQELVQETSNELSAILDASELSIIATDREGTIKQFNRGAEGALGYKAEELVGKSSAGIFHMVNEVVQHSQELTEELGEIVEPAFDVFCIKTRKSGRTDNNEWTYVRKDGSTFPVRLSVTAIKNAGGEITGYLGVARDISKVKQAELNLINSNILLDESQRIAKIGSWKFDVITNDLIWSKGHYTIFEFDELPENKLKDAYRSRIHPEDLVALAVLAEYTIKTGEDFKISYRIILPDGRIKQIIEIGQPYKNKNGEVIGMQGTVQDVTNEKATEQNLRDANLLLDESQRIAKIGSWKFDLVTSDLIWSKGHYQIFELEDMPADQLNAVARSRIHPDDISILDESDKIMMETGNDFKINYRVLFPDDRIKQIIEIGQPYKNEKGDIIGMQGTIQDVTKEKEAELNLIKSKELLDESQRIAKIGSFKFDLITNDLTWSKGHYQIFELEELPAELLFQAYKSRVHPDDLPALDAILENTLKTGEDLLYNHRLLMPDGSLKYVVGIGKVYKNENGDIIGVQGTIQDITEKTLAEHIIIEKAKEINDVRSALDESAIVTITDEKGTIISVNDQFCSISKYSKVELIGRFHYLDNPNFKMSKFIRKIWNTISRGHIWKGEIMNVAKDKSIFWVYSTIVPFLDKEGKPYQYIAISSDITEQKRAQKSLNNALTNLEKTNKELDQFAYVVSHDLKAPLRAINNLSEWIMEDMPEMPDDVSNNFELLRGRVMRMENLINGVLDYSRVGKMFIESQLTDLKRMLYLIVETIVPVEGYTVYIAEAIPEIKIPRILFDQIFTNLISNAIKYNDKPIGKIECLYESLPNFHQFTIKDNGPGIAEEYHEKVFKVFQTIEARDKKESTGVGLSIVQKIIEEQGGTIRIESVAEEGASFIFTIPK
jgi:PAS domain S-box-containing protein